MNSYNAVTLRANLASINATIAAVRAAGGIVSQKDRLIRGDIIRALDELTGLTK